MKKIIILLVAILLSVNCAQAGSGKKPVLSLLKKRVVIEGRDRSATVEILNKGNAKGVYRIEMFDMEMTEKGNLKRVDDYDMSIKGNMIYSPKRIEIGPKEVQTVRFMVRNKNKLEDGEYRSHAKFALLPENSKATYKKDNSGRLSLSIEAIVSFSIPMVVRIGDVNSTGTMSNIRISEGNVSFDIARAGNGSLYGDILVKRIVDGEDEILNEMKGIAVYTNIDKRKFFIPLDLKNPKGEFIIEYRNKDSSIICRETVKI